MTPEQRAQALDIAAQIDRHDWPRPIPGVSTLSLLAEALIAADQRVTALDADNTRLRAALGAALSAMQAYAAANPPWTAYNGTTTGVPQDPNGVHAWLASVRPLLRATCPACHGTGTTGERRSDGAPLVCGECGR